MPAGNVLANLLCGQKQNHHWFHAGLAIAQVRDPISVRDARGYCWSAPPPAHTGGRGARSSPLEDTLCYLIPPEVYADNGNAIPEWGLTALKVRTLLALVITKAMLRPAPAAAAAPSRRRFRLTLIKLCFSLAIGGRCLGCRCSAGSLKRCETWESIQYELVARTWKTKRRNRSILPGFHIRCRRERW